MTWLHVLLVGIGAALKAIAVWKGHPEVADAIVATIVGGAVGNATLTAPRAPSRATDKPVP